eukprot:Sspe_Gene.96648::Locus_69606_Transcript_1_1_Confidence_1.000_Length_348::g.96648::m.96648
MSGAPFRLLCYAPSEGVGRLCTSPPGSLSFLEAQQAPGATGFEVRWGVCDAGHSDCAACPPSPLNPLLCAGVEQDCCRGLLPGQIIKRGEGGCLRSAKKGQK